MQRVDSMGVKYFIGAGVVGTLLLAQGCLATRDWVKETVMDPLSTRASQTEGRMEKAEGQIGSLGNRMSGVEGKLGQFEEARIELAKAIQMLPLDANLHFEMAALLGQLGRTDEAAQVEATARKLQEQQQARQAQPDAPPSSP